jgi:hypothetical protein
MNSQCFGDLVSYLKLDINYPGILDMFKAIAKADSSAYYHSGSTIENSLGLNIEVSKPWIDQAENNRCKIQTDSSSYSIEIITDQNSLFGLSKHTEASIIEVVKKEINKDASNSIG